MAEVKTNILDKLVCENYTIIEILHKLTKNKKKHLKVLECRCRL